MRKSCQKIASRFIFIFAVFCITITGRTALAGSEEAGGEAVAAEPIRMSGQKVYDEVCIACHAPPGVGGAPALGSKEAWEPRLTQGKDTLISHALNGFSKNGIMPKKGGRLDLSDEEIIGAVEFMLGQLSP